MTGRDVWWAEDKHATEAVEGSSEATVLGQVQVLQTVLRDATITSAIDLGAGAGITLRALGTLYPNAHTEAVEINPELAAQLSHVASVVHAVSVFDFEPTQTYDLVIVGGLLSAIDEDRIPQAYAQIDKVIGRFLWLRDFYARERTTFSHPLLGDMVMCDWKELTIRLCPNLRCLCTVDEDNGHIVPTSWLFERQPPSSPF